MVYEIDTSQSMSIQWGCTGMNRIIQNVVNLINTFRYEVAYDRTLGISPDIIDKPADEAGALLTNEIIDLISEREPRAVIKSIDYRGADVSGIILLKVVVEI